MLKRLTTVLLVLLLTCALCLGVSAAEPVASSTCGAEGSNVTWTLDDAGTLTISGKGAMKDYTTSFQKFNGSYMKVSSAPWFSRYAEIKSIVIEKGVTEIGNCAFYGLRNAAKATIPSGVVSIGEAAFSGCGQLTTVSIPGSVKTIERDAFSITGLQSVSIASGVKTIGVCAFNSCYDLKSVKLPDTVTTIGNGAFSCSGLTSMEFPAGLTTLEYRVLAECFELESVVIPASVTSVQDRAFDGCGNLKKVQFMGSAPKFTSEAFYRCSPTVYYPKGNTTWTASVQQNYGGNVKWASFETGAPLKIVTQPKTAYAQKGATVRTTVKAEGVGLTYEWYIKNAGAAKYGKSAVKTASYSCTMTDAAKDRYVRCKITDQFGVSVWTNTVLLRMAATVTDQSMTTYTKQGATAKATVTAAGDGLTYTWYIKNAGQTKYSKSSVTGATYSTKMSSTSKDRLVYCVVKDKYGKTDRTETVRLRMAATITTQPKSVTVAKGEQAKVTVKAVGDGLKYTWYFKDAGATKFSKTTTFTGNSYYVAMTAARNGRQVYCVVTDKYGKTHKSNTVTLKMG